MMRPWHDQGEKAVDALGAPMLGGLEVAGSLAIHQAIRGRRRFSSEEPEAIGLALPL
jgi:hypothetical protein